MRLGLFGTFHPSYRFSGNCTTGLAILLSQSARVRQITVYGQEGAARPDRMDERRVHVRPVWRQDDPVSLLRAGITMFRDRRRLDAFVFNIYVTGFGRARAANSVGLMLPTLTAAATGKPVVVYLHNLLETQDIERLGYRAGRSVRFLVTLLERLILRTTTAFVPLPSQVESMRRSTDLPLRPLFLPYIDLAYELSDPTEPDGLARAPGASAGRRVLLFGYWGPQKDLPGALEVLTEESAGAPPMVITVAGGVNDHFPEYAQVLELLRKRLEGRGVTFLGPVPQERLISLFASNDVLVLPYHATGGQSGPLSLGALVGIPIVAYDLPQLRETAAALRASVLFIPPDDGVALLEAVRSSGGSAPPAAPGGKGRLAEKREESRVAVERLLDEVEGLTLRAGR